MLQRGPIDKDQYRRMINLLKETLAERQQLASKLEEAQKEKHVQELEYKSKIKLLSDFP